MNWNRVKAAENKIFVSVCGRQLWLAQGEEYWLQKDGDKRFLWFPKEGNRVDGSSPA